MQLRPYLLYMLPLTPGADLACQYVNTLGWGVCGASGASGQRLLARMADSNTRCNKGYLRCGWPKISSLNHLPMSFGDADVVSWLSSSLGDATSVLALFFYELLSRCVCMGNSGAGGCQALCFEQY